LRQAEYLRSNPSAGLCSTHVRFVVPEGVTSELRTPSPSELVDGLTGPAAHGSVMIRRDTYLLAGGYRPQFYYAQDIDLWSRIADYAKHLVIPEILYEAIITPQSISGSRRHEQALFHQLIVGATHARRNGRSEDPWLQKAEMLSQACRTASPSPSGEADGAYFLGSCLLKQHPQLARRYFRRCLELNPRHLRARLRLALGR
jgi:hypothetical protein